MEIEPKASQTSEAEVLWFEWSNGWKAEWAITPFKHSWMEFNCPICQACFTQGWAAFPIIVVHKDLKKCCSKECAVKMATAISTLWFRQTEELAALDRKHADQVREMRQKQDKELSAILWPKTNT